MTTDGTQGAGERLRLLAADELGTVRVAEAAGRDALDDLSLVAKWGEPSRAHKIVRCCVGGAGLDELHAGADDPLDDPSAGWLAVAR